MKPNNYIIILLFFIVSCKNNTTEKSSTERTQTAVESKNTDTLINSADYLIIGNRNTKIKIVPRKDSLKFPEFKIIDQKKNVLIFAKNFDESTFEIYEKLNPKYNFNNFKVELYKGELALPDFSSNPEARQFNTRIKEECNNGINFAGKYTLVIWGCGTACQAGVIVDRTNGRIYNDYFSAYGSKFNKESSMIIINSGLIDANTKLINFHNTVDLSVKLWDGSKFVKTK